MADIVRLRNWRHYGFDGKSWVETGCASKQDVAVFVHIGYEPLKAKGDGSDELKMDDVILDMAKHIRAARKSGVKGKASDERTDVDD
jgi:hypothetical protein